LPIPTADSKCGAVQGISFREEISNLENQKPTLKDDPDYTRYFIEDGSTMG